MKLVKNDYYYIIYFKDFIRPVLFSVYFTSRRAAKRALKFQVPSKKLRAHYDVIKGSKLKDFEFKYLIKLGKIQNFPKYMYPQGETTVQQRKSHRTLMRRRLRRMGMLTTKVQNKYNIHDKVIVKHRENKQKVAMSPGTIANAFRLERKPLHIYYIICKKYLSTRKGFLFKVKALRVDTKLKDIKRATINIQRKDIILPHIITEVIKAYGKEKDILDACRKGKVKGYFRK